LQLPDVLLLLFWLRSQLTAGTAACATRTTKAPGLPRFLARFCRLSTALRKH